MSAGSECCEDTFVAAPSTSSSSSSSTSHNIYENLYSSLSYNLPEEDLSSDQKTEIVEIAIKLDVERKEIIYHLCLIDFSKFCPNTKVVFPYKCKQLTTDTLEIKVDSLPIRLKQILYKFVKLAEMSSSF